MKYFHTWVRELAGWGLVAIGLFGFYVCFVMILYRQILEAGSATVISVVLFRGGIHLLKVAVAARVCMQAADRVEPVKPTAPRTTTLAKPADRPTTTSAREWIARRS